MRTVIQTEITKPKQQRVGLIGELLEESESVIHAGDPDEEGQLLIDEILRWFDYKKPVKRLNTGDTTRGGLVKALSHMTDNNDSLNEGGRHMREVSQTL